MIIMIITMMMMRRRRRRTTTTTTMMIIMIIIALKGTDRDFFLYKVLTLPRTVSNTCAQVARAQKCANHVQHIARSSRATCRVSRGTKGQLSY